MAKVKVVPFTPDPTLTGEQNARARQAHYSSEIHRIEALRAAHEANKEGVTCDRANQT